MSISIDKMVGFIRADVIDTIDASGIAATANEYGVEVDANETRTEFIERCVAAELTRCYA